MQRSNRIGRLGLLSLMAIMLAACAGQKEPAEKLIAEIQATVTAASAGGREIYSGSTHGRADPIERAQSVFR